MVRRFGKGMGWPTHALTFIALALVCWGTRLPGGDLAYLAIGVLLWGVLALLWLLRLVIFVILRIRSKAATDAAGWIRWRLRWAVSPCRRSGPACFRLHRSAPSAEVSNLRLR